MYVAIQAVLSLYSSGRTTGIVMDRCSLPEGLGSFELGLSQATLKVTGL